MAGIPLAAFLIGFVETWLVFGVLWIVFRLAKGNPVSRNRVVYVLSYPGVFVAVGGWIGVVIPIPTILGIPLVFVTGQLTGGDDAAWFPAPFMNYAIGFQGPTPTVFAFVAGELALLIAWFIAARLIHRKFSDR